jgi:hypothetical protein
MRWQSMPRQLVHIGSSSNKERAMISHLVAFILGIVVATVGFTGVAQVADKGVTKVQEVVREAR